MAAEIKLWLDRSTPPPEAGWVWATSVTQAKEILRLGLIHEASFEFSLGAPKCPGGCWNEKSGICKLERRCWCICHKPYADARDLIEWMSDNSIWPRTRLRIHAKNPLGRRLMRSILKKKAPKTLEIIG